LEEKSIIYGCKKGHEPAYKALVEKYSPALMAVCVRYMKDKEHAKDVLQDSLIKIIRNIDLYREQGSFQNWLVTITVNTCLKEIKKYRYLEDINSLLEEESGEMSVIDNLNVKDVLNVLNKLPDMQRLVFNLFAIEGYSHAEIGLLLDIAESSSRVYLTRARQFLQQKTKSFEHQK
jgi:RNA polymerase sigma factor (sigma-70 family)